MYARWNSGAIRENNMEFKIILKQNKYGIKGYDVVICFVNIEHRATFNWWWRYKKDAKWFIKQVQKCLI